MSQGMCGQLLVGITCLLVYLQYAVAARGALRERIASVTEREPEQTNFRPMIGILSQPGDFAAEGESYIAASYVKWVEASGARVVPIMYDATYDELEELFFKLNGILIPGGGAVLEPGHTFYDTSTFLFELALKANDDGDFFPFWGTCLGHEVLAVHVSRNTSLLVETDSENFPSPVKLCPNDDCVKSRMLRFLPSSLAEDLKSKKLTMQNHEWSVVMDSLAENPELDKFFMVVASAADRDGRDYMAILEATKYPVYTLSFHPEKILFEWTPDLAIPHHDTAVLMAQTLSRFFISEARRNTHRPKDIVEEDALSIYNYPPTFSGKHKHVDDDKFFEQVYVFKSRKSKPRT